jgi:hypothetical protein
MKKSDMILISLVSGVALLGFVRWKSGSGMGLVKTDKGSGWYGGGK